MYKLLSLRAFNNRKKALLKKYENLLSSADVCVAPGHLNSLELFLEKYEKLVNQNERKAIIRYITEDQKVYPLFGVDASEDLMSLSKQLCNEYSKNIREICRKCSAPIDNQYVCKNHEDFVGLFKEDLRKYQNENINVDESTDSDEFEDIAIIDTVIKTEEVAKTNKDATIEEIINNSSLATRRIKLYDLKQVEKIKSELNRRSSDSDARGRIKELCAGLIQSGPMRSLAVIPKNYVFILKDLRVRFPNFVSLIDQLENAFVLGMLGDQVLKIPNILLVGPPGIGKTYFASELANALSLGFLEIRMENEQNGSALTGSSEFWSNSQTGKIFDLLTNEVEANPLVIIDEIDKVSDSNRYNPISGLYSLLEEKTAKKFEDQSIKGLYLDASNINWIMTANDISMIPDPIISRSIVVTVEKPNLEQAVNIVKSTYNHILKSNIWGEKFKDSLCNDVAIKIAKYEPRKFSTLLLTSLGSAVKSNRYEVNVEDIPEHFNISKSQTMTIGFLETHSQ